MKIRDIIDCLGAECLTGDCDPERDIAVACGSDLMSDTLAFIHSDSLLLTGLTNPQVVRTAEMADIVMICFVRGKRPPAETVTLAKEKGTPLIVTSCSMFEACGRLHRAGLKGWDRCGD